ncbi:MAG TPA: exopolyphosphatase [Rhodocyclaceae bacterium]|nr:exopolyphosphatase [Rhodocyclaceae bacterium]
MTHEVIAAVDLGSNSFRLQVGRIVDNQIYLMDGLKEPVRLAAGLTEDKALDAASWQRGLTALSRFGERLRDFDPGAVRAVATNTLRVATNAAEFLRQGEAALGFPIEVIAGREEARLIYLGVVHTLAQPDKRQLVVDIGGGSTEFIIGQDGQAILLDSLYMGCVSYSMKYFPNARVDKRSFKEAELAARRELQSLVHAYRDAGWDEAIGSSGTAKALSELFELNDYSDDGITGAGLERLRAELLRVGDAAQLRLQGLRPDRVHVLPGGLAIMSAIFKEFGLERMHFSEGALRLGVLYDQLDRYHHEDLREATVKRFMQRYDVDARHAARVARTARDLLLQLTPHAAHDDHPEMQRLLWAAHLHEVGISVAHSGYRRHSAYILGNADMPGFSRQDQGKLSRLVAMHRGKLDRLAELQNETDEILLISLRLAVLLNRARDAQPLPPLRLAAHARGYAVEIGASWLESLPLTASALEEEARQWAAVGRELLLSPSGAAV